MIVEDFNGKVLKDIKKDDIIILFFPTNENGESFFSQSALVNMYTAIRNETEAKLILLPSSVGIGWSKEMLIELRETLNKLIDGESVATDAIEFDN